MKTKVCICILLAAFIALPAAQAGTKEELIRLQSEIATLQKQFLDFNENYSERLDGLRSLIIQLNDQIAKTNNNMSRLDTALNNRTQDARSQDKSLLEEFRSLHEKINDVATGVSVLAQQFNDYKLQASTRVGPASSLSAETMYTQAMRDFTLGDFDMAIEGFKTYVDSYPGGETAAKALLNIGESYSFQNMLPQAVDAFTRVINDYPQATVVPTALYKRANIEIALQNIDNAIADFRDIIERFPTASEANLARSELRRLESAQKPKTVPKATTPARKPSGR